MATPITFTGGAVLGSFHGSFPFAELWCDSDGLRLSLLLKKVALPKDKITGLRTQRGLFSLGLRIEHCEPSAPEYIVFWASLVFWPGPFRRMKAALEAGLYRRLMEAAVRLAASNDAA